MSDHKYIASLARANIFYAPLAAVGNADFGRAYWYIGADLSGETLSAQVGTYPGVDVPLMSLAVAVTETETISFDALVAKGILKRVPRGANGGDEVVANGLVITATNAAISGLPSGPPGHVAEFFWDCRVNSDPSKILMAGTFTVIGGVTQ